MKNLIRTSILSTLILASGAVSAQSYIKGQTYNISKDMTISGSEFPDQCDACTINISKGVTLTINKDISVPGVVFNGGNIVLNNKMSSWATNEFNDINVVVNKKGSIASSAVTKIKNSQFTFNGNSTAVFWAEVTMTNSAMKFLDNASIEVTSTFNLIKSSSLVAGDGTNASKAFIKFNGGTLNESDNSYVSLMNNNNYYFNWADYNGNGKSYKTKENKINCNGAGKNACDAPMVYGPATLSASGVASSAMLPIKLSAFSVKLTGSKVDVAWTTEMEVNAERFEIERSLDGINWSTVGTVATKGNASSVTAYTFTDAPKVGGSISYRLKMIDIDASFEYSPIKMVKAEAAIEMNIYPNPATDYVTISAKNTTDRMNVQLINKDGQILKQTSGSGKVQLSVNEFNTGSYFVRVIDANGAAQSFKLLIRK